MNKFDVRAWNDAVRFDARIRRLPPEERRRVSEAARVLLGVAPDSVSTVQEPTAVAVAQYRVRAPALGETPADLNASTPLAAWDEAWRVAVLWCWRKAEVGT